MMYQSKMVASIKVKGKILREFKDTVYVPFNSEFTILLKNLNTVRAVVNVFVDGENAVPGGLVIDPGRSVDLERWIKNGNLSEGNRFKFIERTAKIEEGPRGIKEEDGLIRVEYQFEMPVISTTWKQYPPGVRADDQFWAKNIGTSATPPSYNAYSAFRSAGRAMKGIDHYCADFDFQNTAAGHPGNPTMDWNGNETGITVPGSKSEQKFQTTTVGSLDPVKHSIVLRIVGDLGNNKPVPEPVTVKHKPKCVTCGHRNKHNAKFCSQCGTSLAIFA